jgi:hypothetical protein
VSQRIQKSIGDTAGVLPRVIDDHDDDHQPAQCIDAVKALTG